MWEGEGKYLYKWQVGASNDELHHWFIFRYTDKDHRHHEYRDEHGNGVHGYGRKKKYVVYRTKKEATEALKEIEKMGYTDRDLFEDLHSVGRTSAERVRRQAEESIAKAERDIARAEARIARLERFPQEDTFEEETVIMFYKKFHPGGTKYTYTALKVNGEWFTSGPTQAGVGRRWVDLVDFISTGPLEPEVWIVTDWERLV